MSGALIAKGPGLADLARRINAEHDAVEQSYGSALDHAHTAGQLLIDAKSRCPHGAWLPWLRLKCNVNERTARTYMQIARRWPEIGPNRQRAADLSLRKAIKIIAPPKPAMVTVAPREISDRPSTAQPTKSAPVPPTVFRSAAAPNLRRAPTPKEIAERKAREDLGERLVYAIRSWRRGNPVATPELVCEVLADVSSRIQDGAEDIEQ